MEYTRTIERAFTVGDRPLLRVANRRGELVIRGEDRDDIQFSARLRVEARDSAEADERFDAVTLPMDQHGDTVTIGPPEIGEVESMRVFGFTVPAVWRSPRLDMVVAVPSACRIEAEQRAGALRVADIHADVRASTRAGRIAVTDVQGRVVVEARAGRVELRSVHGDVRIETRAGRVDVEDVAGDVSIESRTGAVSARAITGTLTCSTRVGAIRAADCGGPFDLSTRTGAAEFRGRVAQRGSIEVGAGRVTLAVTPDSSFFVDALSERGSVRSELTIDDLDEPPGEDAPTVRLRARSGSIRIVRA